MPINNHCNAPLHFGAWSGHTGMVELLLWSGALIEAKNRFKNTTLHFAASKGVVDPLLGKCASIEALDMNRNTPLHVTTRTGSTVQRCYFL